jgi:hypothetical protein
VRRKINLNTLVGNLVVFNSIAHETNE